MHQKDVIYIDVEDDITAIIGKVKNAKEKIVALVPPKRPGMLQSAVNMRLLARAADGANKRLVLITGNAALSGLAASAQIPVAKTLQSPPRLAEVPSFDDDEEDVIDGEQLAVGDHAKMSIDDEDAIIVPTNIEDLNIDNDLKSSKVVTPKKKKGISVPDFGTFRKKLSFIAAGGILLIVFLFWAIAIAPHATVVVSAKTSPMDIKTILTVGDKLANDSEKSTLTSVTQTDKVTQAVDFDATGTKDVGVKASGAVTFANCQDSSSLTVDAGTYISNGSHNYIVQSTVVVPGAHFSPACDSAGNSTPVQVVATDIGDSYNTAAGSSFAVAGFTGGMTATSSAGISGGEKHSATVVTADDVQKARDQMAQQNTDSEKKKLAAKFASGTKVINDSFNATSGDPKLTPGIGEEVKSGKAKLSTDITYSIVGVAQDALDNYLKSAITKQLTSQTTQRIYGSGVSSAQLSDFQAASATKPATVQLAATGQVGPKIDDNQIKQQARGKREGQIIADLKAIDGISDVNVNLSPFWVQGVPDDVTKITVEFRLLTNG